MAKSPPVNAGDMGLVPDLGDPTCHRAAKPVCHSYRGCAPEPGSHSHRACAPWALQQRTLQWDVCSPQPEKEPAQRWRPSTAKVNKQNHSKMFLKHLPIRRIILINYKWLSATLISITLKAITWHSILWQPIKQPLDICIMYVYVRATVKVLQR